MAAAPSEVILEPKKIKSVTVSTFPYLFAMKWWDQKPWSWFFECWVLSQLFHSPLSSSSRDSSSSSLSAISVVSSTYLRLWLFLLAILIPACASPSPEFHMMHIALKLNKQGDNIHPCCTPFPIWNQSIVPCSVLTFFLTCIQISQVAGKVVWYSHLLKNFPVCRDSVKWTNEVNSMKWI